MPIKSEASTPPPRIGKIGPYTVFVTPPATPNAGSKSESPAPVQFQAPPPVQARSPPPVMAPPAQFYKEKPSSFTFFWDAVAKVQNAHASLDEHVAHWFGLNQSKYQWALDDYRENNEKVKQLSVWEICWHSRGFSPVEAYLPATILLGAESERGKTEQNTECVMCERADFIFRRTTAKALYWHFISEFGIPNCRSVRI